MSRRRGDGLPVLINVVGGLGEERQITLVPLP